MKTAVIKMCFLVTILSSSTVFAASGGAEQLDSGMLILFFICFGVMVVLFQATPALITFYSMLKGLFSTSPSQTTFSPFKNTKNGK